MKKGLLWMHPGVKDLSELKGIICDEVMKDLYWDDEDPSYVIASELIYDPLYGFRKQLKKMQKNKSHKIYIFQGGEYVYPDMNIFDYASTWDPAFSIGDRICYKPFRIHMNIEFPEKNELTYEKAKELVKRKKFCNFLYSNVNGLEMRTRLFKEIARYKHVDSLGAYLNNTRIRATRYEKNWEELAIKLKSSYKFTIAVENGVGQGYTTEKLYDTLLAHSVPIYYGDPMVKEQWNPEAFIDVRDYSNMESLLNKIIEIDQNDDLWASMVSSPWKTMEQMTDETVKMRNYKEWFNHIFAQDVTEAIRRPDVYFAKNLYFDFFFDKRSREYSKRIMRGVQNKIKRFCGNRGVDVG